MCFRDNIEQLDDSKKFLWLSNCCLKYLIFIKFLCRNKISHSFHHSYANNFTRRRYKSRTTFWKFTILMHPRKKFSKIKKILSIKYEILKKKNISKNWSEERKGKIYETFEENVFFTNFLTLIPVPKMKKIKNENKTKII